MCYGPGMIHFFPRFSRDAAATPFGAELRASGVEHRIISVPITQNYRRRWALLLVGYPALFWGAFRAARQSLFSSPAPHAVVVSSDVEVWAFALVRAWPGAAKAAIVLMPFIFTARGVGVWQALRLAYYRHVMGRTGLAICHSELEVARYEALFAGTGCRFAFVRWGTHVATPDKILDQARPIVAPPGQEALPLVVAAGKSGRDYRTLAQAAEGLPCRVEIICNEGAGLGGVVDGERLRVQRECQGADYLVRLLRADVVVVPLAVADISAGQMVLIHAMALGRPLVITQTPTITDYVADGQSALLVPMGDAAAMRAAIGRLLEDRALAAALGAGAKARYEAALSGEAHLRDVARTVEAFCGIDTVHDAAGAPRAVA